MPPPSAATRRPHVSSSRGTTERSAIEDDRGSETDRRSEDCREEKSKRRASGVKKRGGPPGRTDPPGSPTASTRSRVGEGHGTLGHRGCPPDSGPLDEDPPGDDE